MKEWLLIVAVAAVFAYGYRLMKKLDKFLDEVRDEKFRRFL